MTKSLLIIGILLETTFKALAGCCEVSLLPVYVAEGVPCLALPREELDGLAEELLSAFLILRQVVECLAAQEEQVGFLLFVLHELDRL